MSGNLELLDISETPDSLNQIDLMLRRNEGNIEEPSYRELTNLILEAVTEEKAGIMSVEQYDTLLELKQTVKGTHRTITDISTFEHIFHSAGWNNNDRLWYFIPCGTKICVKVDAIPAGYWWTVNGFESISDAKTTTNPLDAGSYPWTQETTTYTMEYETMAILRLNFRKDNNLSMNQDDIDTILEGLIVSIFNPDEEADGLVQKVEQIQSEIDSIQNNSIDLKKLYMCDITGTGIDTYKARLGQIFRITKDTNIFLKNNSNGTMYGLVAIGTDSILFNWESRIFLRNWTLNDIEVSNSTYNGTIAFVFFKAFNGTDPITNEQVANNFTLEISNRQKLTFDDTLTAQIGATAVAHRGIHVNDIPEESLNAWRTAARCKMDEAEADVNMTSDGKFVMCHDGALSSSLYENADGTPLSSSVSIIGNTFASIRSNYRLKSDNPIYREPVPSLEEYLDICRKYGIYAFLEIKNSASQITNDKVKEIYDLCCAYLKKDKFGIQSGNHSALDYLRSIDEDVDLTYMYIDIRNTNNTVTNQPRFVKHTHAMLTENNMNADIVKAYRQNGCRVYDGTLVTPNIFNNSVMNFCYPSIITNTCGPDLCGRNGIHLSSEKSWFDGFYTNGTVNAEGMLVLNSNQYIAYSSKMVFLGGIILDVTFKGSINLKSQSPNTSYGINKTVTSNDTFIQLLERPLVYKHIGGFLITAQTNNTIIKRLDFQFAEF